MAQQKEKAPLEPCDTKLIGYISPYLFDHHICCQ